jgi:hypothetical protein
VGGLVTPVVRTRTPSRGSARAALFLCRTAVSGETRKSRWGGPAQNPEREAANRGPPWMLCSGPVAVGLR